MKYSRDPTYYIADGNTVLLVKDTLFKVHRSILIKDQSTFKSMFSLDAHTGKPDGVQEREGDSDENPIRLQGDTVAEVRALMWSLYALPSELVEKITSLTVGRFCDLGRIVHKYQFQSIETWALNALTIYAKDPERPDNYQLCYINNKYYAVDTVVFLIHLPKITELSVLADHSNLRDVVTTKWKILIHDGEELGRAVNMAERLGLRDLLGLAYHAMMLKGRDHWHSDILLTRTHRGRLLSGFYTLTQMCEALPSNPPTLDTSTCVRTGCALVWKELWRDANNGAGILKLQKADLLGRVKLAARNAKRLVGAHGGKHSSLCRACSERALNVVAGKVKEVEECLADLFTDVK